MSNKTKEHLREITIYLLKGAGITIVGAVQSISQLALPPSQDEAWAKNWRRFWQ